MTTKVSILVAVYNAERYLRCCLDSLLQQTIRDIQIICVDDASTDESWTILQDYAAKDHRVEIVHLNENAGQAHARNVGLKQARGQYVCFLDSDDWLAPESLAQIVEKFKCAQDIDVVLFRCLYFYSGKGSRLARSVDGKVGHVEDYLMKPFDVMSGADAFVKSLTWQIHGVYAVKNSIHQRFPYDESARSYSDDNTTRIHYLMARNVANSNAPYFYRQHEASTTHQVSIRRFDYLKANLSMKKQLLELHVSETYISTYENARWINLVGMYLFAKKHARQLGNTDYERAMGLLKSTWKTIEPERLSVLNKMKIGYVPFLSPRIPYGIGWKLFCWEENLYYMIRKMLNNLPE